jgi:peptidyl-prolyl cis-trans isomerase SurA
MRWLWVVLACVQLSGTAFAQNPYSPALTVNDSAITHHDVAQRARLLEALGAPGDVRETAIQQLTEDRLKVQAARAQGIELSEGAIQAGIEEFATTRGLAVEDVTRVLEARGIENAAMNDFVEAGLLWREVVAGRFRERALPSEEELDAAVELARRTPGETFALREIALPFAERGEAETLAFAERLADELRRGGDFEAAAREHSRSDTAAQGGRLEPVPARQLPPAVRGQVLLLEPGGVTRPLPISGGVAILRLDAIRQTAPGATEAAVSDEELRGRLREQIFGQRIENFGEGYLQELQRDALIVQR